MAIAVEVPKLGNTVEECIVARWAKRPGDRVAAGDVVAEIETDKATFEVAAPAAGTLLHAYFDEGALAPVFAKLFVIGEPGETVDGEATSGAGPRARGSVGALGAALPAPQERDPAVEPVVTEPRNGRLSPRARKFASERNFHPGTVNGSGPNGRILERDLLALYSSAAPAPAAGATISSIREKIARRMRESLASTAQYTLHASAGAAGLLALRARLPQEINLNHLVALCTIETLLEIPPLNAEFRDGRIIQHSSVHLAFACDTPRGLLAPVVHHADELTLDELAARMNQLAAGAVAGAIATDDLSGATFTISNLGSLGIEAFTPLLNPPQVAILGVGAIQLKPVRRDGRIEFADTIGLSLTCDHQVIDGAPGARFLQALKRNIENVESWCAIP
jgi:pyruvate dehydrogenase E2 component (dihydrolipoamide acetyltransferase)